VFEGVFDLVKAGKSGGHSVGLVGLVDRSELEAVNVLGFDDFSSSLESFGKHEARVESFFENI
jgi:hypothetical protein